MIRLPLQFAFRPPSECSGDGHWVVASSAMDKRLDIYRDGVFRTTIAPLNENCRFGDFVSSFDGARVLACVDEEWDDVEGNKITCWHHKASFMLYDCEGNLLTSELVHEQRKLIVGVVKIMGRSLSTGESATPLDGSIVIGDLDGPDSCFVFQKDGTVLKGPEAESLWEEQMLMRSESFGRTVHYATNGRVSARFKLDGRRLSLMSPDDEETWSLTANAGISNEELSPGGRTVGFVAGTKVWVVKLNGTVIQTRKHNAYYVFPDDRGGFLSLGRTPEFTRFSPTGEITNDFRLKGEWLLPTRYGEFVAIVTRFDEEDTLWVITVGGQIVLRWSACQRIEKVFWARNRPFLVVTAEEGVAGFSL